MLFYINNPDKVGHFEVRKANREEHLAYLNKHKDNIVFAGPTLSEDEEIFTGSVLVVDFPDRAAVEAFVAQDPYTKANLFESTSIQKIRQWVATE